MHERRFNSEIDKLRSPERIARLEPEKVIKLALEDLNGIKTILDVGTGSGIFAEQFGKPGYKVNGLDANPDMLPIASKYVPEGIFNKGIAEKLPFQDGQFDLVFMGLLLMKQTMLIKQSMRHTGWQQNGWLFWSGHTKKDHLDLLLAIGCLPIGSSTCL